MDGRNKVVSAMRSLLSFVLLGFVAILGLLAVFHAIKSMVFLILIGVLLFLISQLF